MGEHNPFPAMVRIEMLGRHIQTLKAGGLMPEAEAMEQVLWSEIQSTWPDRVAEKRRQFWWRYFPEIVSISLTTGIWILGTGATLGALVVMVVLGSVLPYGLALQSFWTLMGVLLVQALISGYQTFKTNRGAALQAVERDLQRYFLSTGPLPGSGVGHR